MYNLIKRNVLASLIIGLIFIAFSWFNVISNPGGVSFLSSSVAMPLFAMLPTTFFSSTLAGVVASIIIVGLSLFVFYIKGRLLFIKSISAEIAFIFIFILTSIPQLKVFSPALIAVVIIIPVIISLLNDFSDTKNYSSRKDNRFSIGVIIAIASLIYFPSIFLSMLLLPSLISKFNHFSLRGLFSFVMGVAIVYILTFSLFFLNDKDIYELIQTIRVQVFSSAKVHIFSIYEKIAMAYWAVLILISFMSVINKSMTLKTSDRQVLGFCAYSIIVTLAAFFIVPGISIEFLLFAVIPISFYLTTLCSFFKRGSIIFYSMMLVSIGMTVMLYL